MITRPDVAVTLRAHRPVVAAFGDNAPVDCACGPDDPEDVTGWVAYEEHLAAAITSHEQPTEPTQKKDHAHE